MILTITLNPSVDYLYQIEKFNIGTINRIPKTIKMVGGKGINAARISTILGQPTIATGVVAGNNGDYILKGMDKDRMMHSFVKIMGESRNCITIIHDDGTQTELIEQGPYIQECDLLNIQKRIFKLLADYPITVIGLSGSINIENKRIYAELIDEIIARYPRVKIVIDTSGPLLKETLIAPKAPFFIKPNLQEINELLDEQITTEDQIVRALKNKLFSGVFGVLISLGENGGIAKVNNKFFRLHIPKIKVISPEGSGDSTVGGLLAGIDKSLDVVELLKYGMAAGMANAQQRKTGSMIVQDFRDNYHRIKVEEIKNAVIEN